MGDKTFRTRTSRVRVRRAGAWATVAVAAVASVAALIVPLVSSAATVTYHPSGVSTAGSWVTSPTANQWATYLDSNDGATTHAWVSSEDATLTMDLDDPSGMSGPISNVTLSAVVRDPAATREAYRLGMTLDGSTFIWNAAAQTPGSWTTASYASGTAPDGGSWDWAKVQSLKGALQHVRYDEGGVPLTKNSTVQGAATGNNATLVGAATWPLALATNDGNTSYGNVPSGSSNYLRMSTVDTSVAGGQITNVTVYAFLGVASGNGCSVNIGFGDGLSETLSGNIAVNNGSWNGSISTWSSSSAPDGGPWDQTDINDLVLLVKNGSNRSFRVTQLYAVVDYVSSTWNPTSQLQATEMYVTVEYAGDSTPPKVTGASLVNSTTVDVSFDETMAAGTIVAGNFSVNNGLSVGNATLLGDGRTARLTTGIQAEGVTYTVTVSSGAKDLANNGVVAPDNTAWWIRPDTTPPRVSGAAYVNKTTVDVSFNETVAAGSVDVSRFSIAGLTLSGAVLQGDQRTVRLTTSQQGQSTTYTVTVNNGAPSVTDLSGNHCAAPYNTAQFLSPDTIAPKTTGASFVNSITADVSFDETLAAGSVNAAYFTVNNGLSVSAAVRLANGKTVRLTTSQQADGTLYTVTVKSGAPTVNDLAGNPCVAPNNTAQFTTPDITGPKVLSASVVGPIGVDVSFNETVAAGSVNSSYFTIGGLSVSGAVLQADSRTVRLTTGPHTQGTTYTVTVKNGAPTVSDPAGNPCVAPFNTAQFAGTGSGIWVGSGVNVSTNDTAAAMSFVFENVSSPGWLRSTPASVGAKPSNHDIISDYRDIEYDGTFSAGVLITMGYDEGKVVGDEANVKMYHYTDGGAWEVITQSVNTATNRVTGRTTSFSGFGIFTPTGAGDSPHSGYLQTTNKCKVCHAVHEAENASNTLNGEKLLRSTVAAACDYCHVGGPFGSSLQVYGSNPAWYGASAGREHNIGSTFTTIPDSADPAGQATANDYAIAGGLRCLSCHSVHGAYTMPGRFVLKTNPNPSKPGSATTQTEFCTDCHSNNRVTVKDLGGVNDQVSHYMGVVIGATVASAASSECRSCHTGGSIAPTGAVNSYPHYTRGRRFLKDTYSVVETAGSVKLDGVCLDCHPNVSVLF